MSRLDIVFIACFKDKLKMKVAFFIVFLRRCLAEYSVTTYALHFPDTPSHKGSQ